MNCTVIIPAYEPDREMLTYLDELVETGFEDILVVDDGSGSAYASIFGDAAMRPGCTVLTHPENRGKGAAIKTAIRYHLGGVNRGFGVVTADCDGQHCAEDVAKVCRAMQAGNDALVLGSRHFGKDTPQRSAMGNKATSVAMRLLYDIRLEDTQTGLRGIPASMLPAMETLRGDRYEYELNMLIYAKQKCVPFKLVPIRTIYFDNNQGSHFRTVPDAARLVGQMARGLIQYGFFTALAGVVDLFIYSLMTKLVLVGFPLAERLLYAALLARVVSSVVNYICNRRLPYVQNNKVAPTLAKYYLLWATQLAVSYGAVLALTAATGVDEIIIKLAVDALLGIFSYQVQMRWVFRKSDAPPDEVYLLESEEAE